MSYAPRLLRGAAALAFAVSLAACGGHPLLGTWRAPGLFRMPLPSEAMVTATTDFTFKADNTLDVRAVGTATATAPRNPGCTATYEITGLTWASPDGTGAANSLAINGTSATFETITGCLNASENTPRRESSMSMGMGALTGTYTLSGNQLTLTLMAPGSSASSVQFTRQ